MECTVPETADWTGRPSYRLVGCGSNGRRIGPLGAAMDGHQSAIIAYSNRITICNDHDILHWVLVWEEGLAEVEVMPIMAATRGGPNQIPGCQSVG